MSDISPYNELIAGSWRAKTEELIKKHPLNPQELVNITLSAWEDIFKSSIGGFHIGVNIFPKPQLMGFFIQELITLKLIKLHPNEWRGDIEATDKDLVYLSDTGFSIEIKTSSDPNHVFGNRSYAQPALKKKTETGEDKIKKGKSGYYIAINFQPFPTSVAQPFPERIVLPKLLKIRFGWLDHTDWIAQAAATGQQARIDSISERSKLLELYPHYSLGQPTPSLFSLE